jgi:hypothetical protein
MKPRYTRALITFIHDSSGAVTVDWVVMTGAVIGLGAAVMTTVAKGTTDLALATETALAIESIDEHSPYTRRLILNRIKGNGSFAKGRYQHASSLARKISHSDSEAEIRAWTEEREQDLADYAEYRRQQDIWRERLTVWDAEHAND